MANIYTKEDLLTLYRGLPEEIKNAMFSPETTDIFDAIKAKQGLTDAQRETMSVYTGFLMMGVLPPEKYVSTLIEKMGIEREKVASIAQEINRDLFNPIKDVLKEVHAEQKQTPTEVSTPAPEVTAVNTHTPMSISTAPLETIVASGARPMMTGAAPRVISTPQAVPAAPIIPPPRVIPAPTGMPIAQETPNTPPANNREGEATQPHVGSIFEQKLGGEFRLKSDTATYADQEVSVPTKPNNSSI